MSIWNKILLGLIFVASVAFFYLGARAMKVQTVWRNNIRKFEEAVGKENSHLSGLKGLETAAKPGETNLRKAAIELHKLQLHGRIWRDVTRQTVDLVKDAKGKDTINVSLNVPAPAPHQISQGMVCYLFDKKNFEEGGRYLGEFSAVAVADKQVQLQPTKKFSDREINALKNSQGPWFLFEAMPVDDHEIFQDYEGLDKLIPASTLNEYVQDGKPTDPNNKESAKFERKLRDYEVLFQVYHKKWSVWTDSMEAIKRDRAFVETALADAKEQVDQRDKEIVQTKAELTDETRKRNAVAKHLKSVETKLVEVNAAIRALDKSNRAMAAEIARIQLEATRRIDAQSRKMAQYGTGP